MALETQYSRRPPPCPALYNTCLIVVLLCCVPYLTCEIFISSMPESRCAPVIDILSGRSAPSGASGAPGAPGLSFGLHVVVSMRVIKCAREYLSGWLRRPPLARWKFIAGPCVEFLKTRPRYQILHFLPQRIVLDWYSRTVCHIGSHLFDCLLIKGSCGSDMCFQWLY